MRTPHLPPLPPIWNESRFGLEAASLLRSPVFRGEGVADAGGQPVLLIPGFMAGDNSFGLMTRWLRRTGHHTSRAGMRMNVNCSEAAVDCLEKRLDGMAERHGRRVAIVGQSRGGQFARALAVRRPELVSGIVTLGTPTYSAASIHPLVRVQVFAVGVLGSLGTPGLFRHSCLGGDCCRSFAEELVSEFPAGVGYLSVYSRKDGIVDWRSCLDPDAEHLEVAASHCGMSVNSRAYRAVADALESYREQDAKRRPAARASAPSSRRKAASKRRRPTPRGEAAAA